jgi:hypothetical protein
MRQSKTNVEKNGRMRSVAVISGLLALLCSLPVAVSSAHAAIGQAQPDEPPTIIEINIQVPLLNPCIGEETIASITGIERFTFSQNDDANTHRFNIVDVLDVETGDGFVGRETAALTHVGEGVPRPPTVEDWGILAIVDQLTAQNPTTNQLLMIRFQRHWTYRDGEFMVNFDNFNAECRGQP